MRARVMLLLAAAACGGGKDGAPSSASGGGSGKPAASPIDAAAPRAIDAAVAAPAIDAAPLAACVPAADSLRTTRVVDGTFVACYGDDDKACFAFDPATGAAKPHARLARLPDPPTPAGIVHGANDVKVCKPGSTTDCRTFK